MAAPPTLPPVDPNQPDVPRPGLQNLFDLCAVVTALVWLQMVIGFFRDSYSNQHGSMSYEMYLLILGAYSGTKEFKRLTGTLAAEAADQRLIQGKYFVWLWVLTGVAMTIYADTHGWPATRLPHDLRLVVWSVVGFFCGTTCIKAAHEKRLPWSKNSPVPAPGPIPPQAPAPTPRPEDPDDEGTTTAPDAALEQRVLDFLGTSRDGYTRAQIQDGLERNGFKVERKTLTDALNRLIARKLVIRWSKGSGDPNTRYVLREFVDYPPD